MASLARVTRTATISDQYEQGLITDDERYSLTVETWRNIDKEILKVLSEKISPRRHQY